MKKNSQPVFLLLLFFFISCSSDPDGNSMVLSEGMIEYDVAPIDPGSPLAGYAPKKMTVRFKDDKICAEINTMVVLTTSFISNPETKIFIQLVSLLSSKSAAILDSNEVRKNMIWKKLIIHKSDDTKLIAGYKCKKANVSFENGEHPDFSVYYTNDINIKNPNWSNAFHEINGVLMEYQMERYGLEIKFTAKSVVKKIIDDAVFELPKDCKIITEEQMNEMFESLK